MEGLLAWLKEPSVGKVVFAKNCALSIRAEVLAQVAAIHGKELEFVQAPPSPRTSIQGKGYGEGDLIRQALDKSEVLRAAHDFIKVTGKLFMPDAPAVFTGEGDGEFFDVGRDVGRVFPTRQLLGPAYRSPILGRVMAAARKCRVPWEWIAAVPSGWVDTRCYRCEIEFYREYLLNSHKRVRDALGYTLENAVFDDLQESERIRRMTFTPIIVGVSGTLGTQAGSFSDDLRREASDLTDRLLSN